MCVCCLVVVCGVSMSVVLWLLQLGLCCTVFATVAGSEKNCSRSEKKTTPVLKEKNGPRFLKNGTHKWNKIGSLDLKT